jgi:signal peptidase II
MSRKARIYVSREESRLHLEGRAMQEKNLVLRNITVLKVGGSALIADFFTKQMALGLLSTSDDIWFGPLVFSLRRNPGAFLSSMQSTSLRLEWISILAATTALMLCLLGPKLKVHDQWAIGLILAGALGNGIDRLMREGGVIDFFGIWLLYGNWTNLSDLALTIGFPIATLSAIGWTKKLIKKRFQQKRLTTNSYRSVSRLKRSKTGLSLIETLVGVFLLVIVGSLSYQLYRQIYVQKDYRPYVEASDFVDTFNKQATRIFINTKSGQGFAPDSLDGVFPTKNPNFQVSVAFAGCVNPSAVVAQNALSSTDLATLTNGLPNNSPSANIDSGNGQSGGIAQNEKYSRTLPNPSGLFNYKITLLEKGVATGFVYDGYYVGELALCP